MQRVEYFQKNYMLGGVDEDEELRLAIIASMEAQKDEPSMTLHPIKDSLE